MQTLNENIILDTNENALANQEALNQLDTFDEETRLARRFVPGYLYAFTSSWIPSNTYKVGYTTNLADRLGQFSTSHLNARFVFTCPKLQYQNDHFNKETNKPLGKITLVRSREQAVHKLLSSYRCQANREFFECSLDKIKEAFDKVESMSENELIAYIEDIEYVNPNSFEAMKYENEKLKLDIDAKRGEIKVLNLRLEILKDDKVLNYDFTLQAVLDLYQ